MNDFQESLKELLIDNNLNYANLNKALNLSSGTISSYFCNGTYPTVEISIKLAEFFNCSLDYLFGLTDIQSPTYKINFTDTRINFVNNFEKCLKNA